MEDFSRWEDSYSVGIPKVDEQHKRLVEIINELHEGLSHNREDRLETFKSAAKNCVAYVQEHFATEEAIMTARNYPGLAEHKALHAEFIKQVLESVSKFEHGDHLAPNRFLRFLMDWLLSHIAYEDMEWARAVRAQQG